jgi:hypothetical protein
MFRTSTLRGEASFSDYVEQPEDWTNWQADYFYFKGAYGLEYPSLYEWEQNPERGYYGAYRPVPGETFPAKDQSHFSRLLNALNDNVGPSLYVQRNRVFSGLNNKDRIQYLYGDGKTPHSWIKGVTEKEVDAIDVVGEANNAGISKRLQYIYGLDIDPALLPYQELGQP